MTLTEVVKPILGWCTEDKAKRLYSLVKECDSQLTIELGVFGGRSLIPMALAHKEKGSGIAIGIDAWKASVSIEGTNSPANDDYWKNVDYPSVYKSCQEHIVRHGIFDFCSTLKLKTQQAAALFDKNSIDILHQDSGHNVETITDELKLWSDKLKIGGYWIADDVQWVEAVEGYAQLPEYGLELFEDYGEWQIWRKVK